MHGVSLFLLVLFSVGTAGLAPAVPSDPLSRGIALYQENKDEAAIIELRRAIDLNRGRALGYYYAACIRLRLEQPVTARNNLLAALSDSTGFHDAVGLLAWTNLKLGNTADALIGWRRFTGAVGELHPGERVSASSIMLPEEYRERLARVHTVAASDSAAPGGAVAVMPADSTRPAVQTTVGKPDSAGSESKAALSDLNRKIEGQIRRGYYGIGAASALLAAGIAGIAWWMRKRRKSSARPDFLAEVDRLLESPEEADEFSLDDEELSARGGRGRVRERGEEVEKQAEGRRQKAEEEIKTHKIEREENTWNIPEFQSPEIQVQSPNLEARDQIFGYSGNGNVSQGVTYDSTAESSRRTITEEVKTLVARLFREGQSAVDIARLADLTRTEVELIVAVRTRDVEQIVETALEEQEPEATAIHRAVAELAAEGRNAVEIARRLGISTSEVSLALTVMESWKKGKKR